jgi:hypothetical protein
VCESFVLPSDLLPVLIIFVARLTEQNMASSQPPSYDNHGFAAVGVGEPAADDNQQLMKHQARLIFF